VEEEYERLVSEGLSKRPTAVIHHGINSQGFDGESSESLKRWAEKRFILAVSSTRPTKNIRRLLQALAELHKVAPDVLLLIAGRGDMKAELMQQATELGVADSLHFLGMLTDPELGYLYRHAQVLAYPSIAEGFGFPIVEAYSQGCPVMCSNVSSPAELGQGAAHFVDPLSVKSIADGLIKIILDREYRQTLAEASRKRVLDFHWDRAGQKTLEVYRAMA
jgi:glycosyltransferase involved in cell wall biosynthesis